MKNLIAIFVMLFAFVTCFFPLVALVLMFEFGIYFHEITIITVWIFGMIFCTGVDSILEALNPRPKSIQMTFVDLKDGEKFLLAKWKNREYKFSTKNDAQEFIRKIQSGEL